MTWVQPGGPEAPARGDALSEHGGDEARMSRLTINLFVELPKAAWEQLMQAYDEGQEDDAWEIINDHWRGQNVNIGDVDQIDVGDTGSYDAIFSVAP